MNRILLLIIALLCIGYFFYSKHNGPGISQAVKHIPIFSTAQERQDVSFKMEDNRTIVSDQDTRIEFTKTEPFNIKGYIVGADHPDKGLLSVFAGTYGIVWGDTAIELASAPPEKMKDLSYFSPEARKVIQEQGCAAGYLNNHIVSIMAIAENAAIDKTLRNVGEMAIIDARGYKIHIDSVYFKGESVSMNLPNTVCITEVSVTDKAAGK